MINSVVIFYFLNILFKKNVTYKNLNVRRNDKTISFDI